MPSVYQGVLLSFFLSGEEVDFPVDGCCLVVLGSGVRLVGACVFLAGTLGAVAGRLAAADGSLPVAAPGGSVCFGDAASGVGSALGSAFGPAVGPGSAGCAGGRDGRGNRRARRPCWQWCDERGNCIGQGLDGLHSTTAKLDDVRPAAD
jgi:hypothetical protein